MIVDELKQLQKEGKIQEAIQKATTYLEEHPNDGKVLLETAYLHDRHDMDPQAVQYYQSALETELEDLDRRDALLALGSTYRAVGLYENARETLEIGMSEFPDYNAFYVFFAMTLYNLGDTDLAMEIVMTKLLETTDDESIKQYSRALEFYASRLDEVFN
ncbi:tetratricopeptide repeat protein [Aquisalibacillus elongatus]|uniref:Tetratricopeptide repeat protein n=1 Tax=Aquisalibacillus elongatus TaxID=485577 RepID=A0A3N5B9E6_9BACI|nr:tetratricopeptide repeat protein [Aquisalibacillus elongatus]RPF54013.1 tetratricopeptide repeat protein [Aquisalibacillus elongatus]